MIKRRTEKISVCMATHNGCLFLVEQLESIYVQLSEEDELIVVDDCSSDETVNILESFSHKRFFKIIKNKSRLGVNKSFELAISQATNDILFLSDQDDVWTEGRVDRMLSVLKPNGVELVSGNTSYIDQNGDKINMSSRRILLEKESTHMINNLFAVMRGDGGYYGCAMAFKSKAVNTLLPFPRYIESHDLWIAKAAILAGTSRHLEQEILCRRIHGSNISLYKRNYFRKCWSRIIFLVSILHLMVRITSSKLFRSNKITKSTLIL